MLSLTTSRLECLRGRESSYLDATDLVALARQYTEVHLDLGTGDGRYVEELARAHPDWLVIGLDACREGLRERSRKARAGGNALFLIANALHLPPGLAGLATRITINFPWGSLIEGLVTGEPTLFAGLLASSRHGASLECRLNGGALAEVGWTLEAGAAQIRQHLRAAGFRPCSAMGRQGLDARALRACPTTWAKRLAFGRDPRGVILRAVRCG